METDLQISTTKIVIVSDQKMKQLTKTRKGLVLLLLVEEKYTEVIGTVNGERTQDQVKIEKWLTIIAII
jgi:hypothetical protein